MQSSSLFLLVLLALGALVPWTAEGAANPLKPGNCPARRPGRCLNPPLTPPCQSDRQCPGRQLCCSDVCGFTCLDPVDVSDPTLKAGNCPAGGPGRCLTPPLTPPCQSDWQCPGRQLCCSDVCGFTCLDPVSISDPRRRKPGSCPQVNGQCLILNPRNYCDIDGDCADDYKCCTGLCGKSCVKPELA